MKKLNKSHRKIVYILMVTLLLLNTTLLYKEILIKKFTDEKRTVAYVNLLPNILYKTDTIHNIDDVVFYDTYAVDDNLDSEENCGTKCDDYSDRAKYKEQKYFKRKICNIFTKIKKKDDKIIAEIDNMYPGSSGKFEFVIKNTGNIPAVFEAAYTDITDSLFKLANKIYVVVGAKCDGQEIIWEEGPFTEMENILNALYAGMRLDPEETIKTQMIIYFDRYGTLTEGNMNENEKVILGLTMNWPQQKLRTK